MLKPTGCTAASSLPSGLMCEKAPGREPPAFGNTDRLHEAPEHRGAGAGGRGSRGARPTQRREGAVHAGPHPPAGARALHTCGGRLAPLLSRVVLDTARGGPWAPAARLLGSRGVRHLRPPPVAFAPERRSGNGRGPSERGRSAPGRAERGPGPEGAARPDSSRQRRPAEPGAAAASRAARGRGQLSNSYSPARANKSRGRFRKPRPEAVVAIETLSEVGVARRPGRVGPNASCLASPKIRIPPLMERKTGGRGYRISQRPFQ